MRPCMGFRRARYDATALLAKMRAAQSDRDRGLLEIELSRAYLQFAHDLSGGALDGRRIDSGIKRAPVRRPSDELLAALADGEPRAVLRNLAPKTPEYTRLMREKLTLERVIARGGWGAPVTVGKLEPGDSGAGVVLMRDRLIEMGYLQPTLSAAYDDALRDAVLAFQEDHGSPPTASPAPRR